MGKAEQTLDRTLTNTHSGGGASRAKRVASGAALLVLGATLLTGCVFTNSAPTPETTTSVAEPPPVQEDPRVAELAAKSSGIQTAVQNIVPQEGFPARELVQSAITDTGIPLEQVSVGQAITPTNLAVDAMQFAVNDADVCLVGEIRGGAVSMTQMPALAGGACFVGDEIGR